METTDYADVLAEAANDAGLDPDNLSGAEWLIFRRYAKSRLEKAWLWHYWPDLARCEQRFFRLPWNAASSYAPAVAAVDNSANEVWWALTGGYYVALTNVPVNTPPTDASGNIDLAHWGSTSSFAIQPDPTGSLPVYWPSAPPWPAPWVNVLAWSATTTYTQGDRVQYCGQVYQLFTTAATGAVPTDATNWGLIPPFDAYVPYEQSGQTALGVVEDVFSANPRTTTRGNTLNWSLSERGVEVLTPITFGWVQYRVRCPKLNGSLFNAALSYAPGAQMYYSTSLTLPGNFYEATATTTAGDTPDSAPGEWAVVQIPRVFHRYLVLGMASDWMKKEPAEDPETAQAIASMEVMAMEELDNAKSLYVGQMGQRVKTEVRTR